MEGSDRDIQPIPRDPLRFELLPLFAAHLDARGGRLQDVDAQGEFLASLGPLLTRAVADSTLARGLRNEEMFAALVASLGQIMLIKKEDAGTVWTARELTVPDYRVVLPDGSAFLVEVKHFHQGNKPTKPYPITRKYLAELRAYGELVGCPVKLAVYWERWNLWTLVPLSACERGGRTSLPMERAMQENEMGILGDLHIATRFPLRLRLMADPTRPRTLGDHGEVAFTIAGVELSCGKRRLTSQRDKSLAVWLMVYGKWEEEAAARIKDGELVAVDVVRTPIEDHGQGFEFIGMLSSMFSSWYLSSTSDEDLVTRLGIKVTGGSLAALIPDDYDSDALPLWRLQQDPPRPAEEPA